MSTRNGKENYLPSRAISYAYTAAMHFGQQLEVNLKAILYAADFHGWGADIKLEEAQLKRFKDTGGFIDGATCGQIIEKLRATGVIPDTRAWKAFERACAHRNKLAHIFLTEQDFGALTKQSEAAIIRELHEMTVDLYQALLMSRSVRERAEHLADEDHKKIQSMMKELGIEDYENPNRHYATRKRERKGNHPAI